jgi:hypothetical protein
MIGDIITTVGKSSIKAYQNGIEFRKDTSTIDAFNLFFDTDFFNTSSGTQDNVKNVTISKKKKLDTVSVGRWVATRDSNNRMILIEYDGEKLIIIQIQT